MASKEHKNHTIVKELKGERFSQSKYEDTKISLFVLCLFYSYFTPNMHPPPSKKSIFL